MSNVTFIKMCITTDQKKSVTNRLILVSETRFPCSLCWRLRSSGLLAEVTDTERSFETSSIINAAAHREKPKHINRFGFIKQQLIRCPAHASSNDRITCQWLILENKQGRVRHLFPGSIPALTAPLNLYVVWNNTGLFEMIAGVLTTCHTQYTWDRSICIFFI